MTDLAPALSEVLTPTPGHLADILHVELSVGDRADTFYGTDTYGSWDYGGQYAWVRWDCDITSLQLFRGRQMKLERNSPGVCTFTAVQIVPSSWLINPPSARPARIVTSTGATVFVGLIEAAVLTKEYGHAEWSVTIVDDLARLGRLIMPTLTRPAEDLGARVDALLAAAGMPAYRHLYGYWVQAVAGSDRKILDEICIAVDTWRCGIGSVEGTIESMPSPIIDRTGSFQINQVTPPDVRGKVYGWELDNYRYPWRVSPDPSAAHAYNAKTWIGDALSYEMTADVADVRNYLTYSNAGGTAVVTQDAASVAKYEPRSYQRMDLIGADGGGSSASVALDQWRLYTMEPVPKVRIKQLVVDCWNRPAGAIPLVELLAGMDAGHLCEVFLPDQDDAGGDISVEPPDPWYEPTFTPTPGHYIYGITWDLADGQAMLTLSMDAPIKRTV